MLYARTAYYLTPSHIFDDCEISGHVLQTRMWETNPIPEEKFSYFCTLRFSVLSSMWVMSFLTRGLVWLFLGSLSSEPRNAEHEDVFFPGIGFVSVKLFN